MCLLLAARTPCSHKRLVTSPLFELREGHCVQVSSPVASVTVSVQALGTEILSRQTPEADKKEEQEEDLNRSPRVLLA